MRTAPPQPCIKVLLEKCPRALVLLCDESDFDCAYICEPVAEDKESQDLCGGAEKAEAQDLRGGAENSSRRTEYYNFSPDKQAEKTAHPLEVLARKLPGGLPARLSAQGRTGAAQPSSGAYILQPA